MADVLSLDSHGRDGANTKAPAADAPPSSRHPGTDVQVEPKADVKVSPKMREGRAWASVTAAQVIHDDGGETRAGKRLGRVTERGDGRKSSPFVRARLDGRRDWMLGDLVAALSPDGLDDLGKALRTRALTLRGHSASSMGTLERARRVHTETSEAHDSLLAVLVSGGDDLATLEAAAKELVEAEREIGAARREILDRIRDLRGARGNA